MTHLNQCTSKTHLGPHICLMDPECKIDEELFYPSNYPSGFFVSIGNEYLDWVSHWWEYEISNGEFVFYAALAPKWAVWDWNEKWLLHDFMLLWKFCRLDITSEKVKKEGKKTSVVTQFNARHINTVLRQISEIAYYPRKGNKK